MLVKLHVGFFRLKNASQNCTQDLISLSADFYRINNEVMPYLSILIAGP